MWAVIEFDAEGEIESVTVFRQKHKAVIWLTGLFEAGASALMCPARYVDFDALEESA